MPYFQQNAADMRFLCSQYRQKLRLWRSSTASVGECRVEYGKEHEQDLGSECRRRILFSGTRYDDLLQPVV
jgi:hypothetical protein